MRLLQQGSQGLNWQVDLPSLTSLVLHLSTSALKGFAQAGVGVHTLLCMGEIAEKCPASTEYRRELNACRQKQRKDSIWFHKIVELGSATNFVADELLKTRARENIIALLSTVLPVMPESSCDELILKLFDKAGAPLDKTPGFGQLRSLRETLLPLARKVSFKDQVFRYHLVARKLLQDPMTSDRLSAYASIPSEETATHLILSLSTLTQDHSLVLHYHGLKGSGWVIAYARHVLGLPVCIMSSASDAIPISGDYQSAKVLVHISHGEGKLEVLAKGHVRDLLVTQSLDPGEYSIWCLDLKKIDILSSYLPEDFSRSAVTIIMKSMVIGYLDVLAACVLANLEPTGEKTITYLRYCLPKLYERAHEILDLLGCEPQQNGNYSRWSWREYFSPLGLKRASVKAPKISSSHLFQGSLSHFHHLLPGPAWITSRLGHLTTTSAEDVGSGEPILDPGSVQRVSFLVKLVDATAWLAFSNWHLNIQLLSVKWLETDLSWKDNRPLDIMFAQVESNMEGLGELDEDAIGYFQGFYGPVGEFGYSLSKRFGNILNGEDSDFQDDGVLAFSYRGIVYAHNAAIQEALDMEAQIFHLACGTMIVAGEPQKRIHFVFAGDQPNLRREPDAGSQPYQTQHLTPSNQFPSISLTAEVKNSDEGFVLHRKAIIDNTVVGIISPGDITRSLLSMFVSSPCEHGYYHTAEPTLEMVSTQISNKERSAQKIPIIVQGLCLSHDSERTWLQAVDQNSAGQWLAYQMSGVDEQLSHTILQRDCCIQCIVSRLIIHQEKYILDNVPESMPTRQHVRIIPGRLKGE